MTRTVSLGVRGSGTRRARVGAAAAVAVAVASAALLLRTAGVAQAGAPCRLEAGRVAIHDGGDHSVIELSARVRASSRLSCVFDLRLLALSTTRPSPPPLPVLVARWVDQRWQAPLRLPQGPAGAELVPFRVWSPTDSAVVAVRIIVEGTASGLTVEVPAAFWPQPLPGAIVEKNVRAPRAGIARFDRHEPVLVPAVLPGLDGTVSSSDQRVMLDAESTHVEFVPTALPTAPLPRASTVLGLLRDQLPKEILEAPPVATERWDRLAQQAYAAALHSDPLVATLGARSLGWMARGLTLGPEPTPDTDTDSPEPSLLAELPEVVRTAIGDVDGRLGRQMLVVGRLMPLGRKALLRVVRERPWDMPARAEAARSAVRRLGAIEPSAVVRYVQPPLWDDTAPQAPSSRSPAASPGQGTAPSHIAASEEIQNPEAFQSSSPRRGRGDRHVWRRAARRWLAWALVLLAWALWCGWQWRYPQRSASQRV